MTPENERQKLLDVCVPCRAACPIRTRVPEYIEALAAGDTEGAYAINRRDNIFPGVLGRVCHRPCEPACRHGRAGNGDPVQICFLKRAASDRAVQREAPPAEALSGKTACVIGSGPAGLTVANDLTLAGWAVTVLEQFEAPGGMLRYGIPAFRLPRDIVDKDIASILELGVTLKTGERVSTKAELDTLNAQYDAVVIAGGCMQAATLDTAPSDTFQGAIPGLEYMNAANLGTLQPSPGRVVVIGGGFTAVDCARTALRHGAEDVSLVYRRTHHQMRVGPNELAMLNKEGIQQHFLAEPDRLLKEGGVIRGVMFNPVTLDETGAIQRSGDPGIELKADQVILAIGQDAEDWDAVTGPETDDGEGVYFTGDFREGSGTVIDACASGRKTAIKIRQHANDSIAAQRVTVSDVPLDTFQRTVADTCIPPQAIQTVPSDARPRQDDEVELGLGESQTTAEAQRCYLCNYVFSIDSAACIYCMKCIDVMPVGCISLTRGPVNVVDGRVNFTSTENYNRADGIVIDHDACIRCGECARVCPVNCITIERLSVENA